MNEHLPSDELKTKFQLVRKAIMTGNHARALDLLTKIAPPEVEARPSTASSMDGLLRVQWLVLRGIALTRYKNPQQGLLMTKKALDLLMNIPLPPEQALHHSRLLVEAQLAMIESLERLGRFDEALELLDKTKASFQLVSSEYRPRLEAELHYLQGTILFRQGELEKAMNTLNKGMKIIQTLPLNLQQTFLANFFNRIGAIHHVKGELDRALEYYERSLELRSEIGNDLAMAAILNNIGVIYHDKGELDRALEYHAKSLVLRKKLGNPLDIAMSLNNMGIIYHDKGELDRALECHSQSLALKKQFGNPQDLAAALNNIGNIYYEKGELDQALDYLERSLNLKKELGNPRDIAMTLNNIGSIYREKGELDQALTYLEQSLTIRKELGNPRDIAESLLALGLVHLERDDYQQALTYLEESLTIREAIGNPIRISDTLFHLISVAIDMGDSERTKRYLTRLEEISTTEENDIIHQRHQLCHALVLKHHPRARDKLEAQQIFEQVVNNEVISHELTTFALLHYCELLLYELQLTGDETVLARTREVLERLLDVADHQHSRALMAQACWLLSKVALLEGEPLQARTLMTRAQVYAEEWGLGRLAARISDDHDALLARLDVKTTNASIDKQSLAEQVSQVQLDFLLQQVTRKRVLANYDMNHHEEPAWLLIMAASGIALYFKVFSEKLKKSADLMSAFLKAILSMSQIIFSQALDRMKLGEYTVVMSPTETILLIYACKGSSFRARQRLLRFKEILLNHDLAWSQLLQMADSGKHISKAAKRTLDTLTDDLFQVTVSPLG